MTLSVYVYSIGPMGNNSYLLYDTETGQGVVVDPSFGSKLILEDTKRMAIQITAIWLTHAHFDHIAGISELTNSAFPPPSIGIHKNDLPLYRENGGAAVFGFEISPGPEPSLFFEHGQILRVGRSKIEVRHTPGHTPGHVVFYAPTEGLVLCGDLIFRNGIGRTDLPGGSYTKLINGIQTQIFTLPPETRLLSGHGPETTVADEVESLSF